mmetsp:Transcript_20140/g.33401  ORF Transcript_20140/g.33401 Transcript_20140/m.33401 type:complete len:380 (+) Transcript_20140:318-1457(+)
MRFIAKLLIFSVISTSFTGHATPFLIFRPLGSPIWTFTKGFEMYIVRLHEWSSDIHATIASHLGCCIFATSIGIDPVANQPLQFINLSWTDTKGILDDSPVIGGGPTSCFVFTITWRDGRRALVAKVVLRLGINQELIVVKVQVVAGQELSFRIRQTFVAAVCSFFVVTLGFGPVDPICFLISQECLLSWCRNTSIKGALGFCPYLPFFVGPVSRTPILGIHDKICLAYPARRLVTSVLMSLLEHISRQSLAQTATLCGGCRSWLWRHSWRWRRKWRVTTFIWETTMILRDGRQATRLSHLLFRIAPLANHSIQKGVNCRFVVGFEEDGDSRHFIFIPLIIRRVDPVAGGGIKVMELYFRRISFTLLDVLGGDFQIHVT